MLIVSSPYRRQKEQFSDGVGFSWIDSIKEHAGMIVSDEKMADAATRYPMDTPDTKEAYMIREIFERHFPSEAAAGTAVRWAAPECHGEHELTSHTFAGGSRSRSGASRPTRAVAPSRSTTRRTRGGCIILASMSQLEWQAR